MYEKISLTNGDILNDYHLNHLQEGILNIEKESKNFRAKLIKILKAKGIPCSADESFDILAQKVNYLNGSYVPNDSDGEEGENPAIDIRETVKSGQIQILFTDITTGHAEFRLWTGDGSQYSVDWGDGETGIYNSGSWATHDYVKGKGGEPYGESNTQWVATISCNGNQFYRFAQQNKSDMLWFASRDVYFEHMHYMLSASDNANHAPTTLKYFDMIGGGLSCNREPSCAGVFRSCTGLERISGTINLLGASSAYYMFYGCSSLKELPVVLNLSSVTSCTGIFQGCAVLERLPNFVSTENVTSFQNAFYGCRKLKEIPSISLKGCTNATNMFYQCTELQDVSKLTNLGSLTTANSMFDSCTNLRTVPNIMDLGSCTNCSYMFSACSSLLDAPATIYLDSATNLEGMFNGCTALRTPPTTLSAPVCTNAYRLFYNCLSLRSLPRMVQLPMAQNVNQIFGLCKTIRTAPDEIDFPEAIYARDMFTGCDMLEQAPRVIKLPSALEIYQMFINNFSLIKTPEIIEAPMAQKAYQMFYDCRILQRCEFETLDLPSAAYIYNMFYNCRNLLEAPVINAPLAQDAYSLFYNCERMTKAHPLDLPRAMSMNTMYYGCKALEEIPEINAPIATTWRQTYQQTFLAQKIATPWGPAATDIYYNMWETYPKILDIGNVLDLTNITTTTNWFPTNDPMYLKGAITIKGCKGDFYLRNCRSVTSIRFQDMSPLCGNLDFRNCALEAEDINLLFGDLVTTNVPVTINVAGNPGASTCNPEIAMAKGWTVTK